MYRIKEIWKDSKTQYIIQHRYLWFFWLNMSEPIEDKEVADGLLILLKYKK